MSGCVQMWTLSWLACTQPPPKDRLLDFLVFSELLKFLQSNSLLTGPVYPRDSRITGTDLPLIAGCPVHKRTVLLHLALVAEDRGTMARISASSYLLFPGRTCLSSMSIISDSFSGCREDRSFVSPTSCSRSYKTVLSFCPAL